MNFQLMQYLPVLLLGLLIFWFLTVRVEKKYFQWVKDHWFHSQSRISKLSSLFYFAGFALLLLALLDLRGPEERVKGKISEQKTVLLIDSSASMLAEDVRPNRFEKAILLAKHFIKKAVGHQISVVVFSDGQKRIIPFTNDKDLVEARLNTLENLNLDRGGTGLSLAIQESVQYFVNSGEQTPFGNIIILTDAEETDGGLKLNVPEGISVAVVAVGTAKGGPIPLRNARGTFKGNKKHNGETVISKLNEDFLKKLGDDIEHFKYWVASSYSIPTEKILKFFDRSLKAKLSKDDFRIRPVLANYLMIPGVLALIVAFALKSFPSFAICLLLLAPGIVKSQETEEKEPVKTPLILKLEKRFAENTLDREGKEKLASELLKQGFLDQSKQLYQEILPQKINESNKKDFFNYGTAQFKSESIPQGVDTFNKLTDYLKDNPSEENNALLEEAKKNILKAIQAQAAQQKKQKSGEQDEKKQEKEGQKGEKGEQGEKSDQKKQGQGKGEQDEKKEEDEQGKDQKGKGKDQGDESDQNQDKKDKKGDPQQGEKENKEKMPSILKQLMSDDNQLQKKVIDANTVERKTREKKDW